MNSCLNQNQNCKNPGTDLSDFHTAERMLRKFSTKIMLHPHWKKHPCKNPICKKDLSCFSASDPHNCTEYFRCCQACKNPLSTHILHFSPGITGHFQEQKNQNKRKTVGNSYRFMHSMKKQIQSSNMKSRKIQDNQCTCRNLFHSTDLFVKKIHSCKKQYCTATI